jgi:type IV secretion system protein VirB10
MAVVLGIVVLVLGFLFYNIFFSGDDEEAVAPRVVDVAPTPIIPTPALPQPEPEPPAITMQPPVLTPIEVPQAPNLSLIQPEDDGAAQQARLARLRSGMLVGGSGGGLGGVLGGGDDTQPQAAVGGDANSQFEASVVNANSKAPAVRAGRLGDLRRTIAQGRLIHATTESALNTELPAPIRAIVSRDTYGEAGTEVLIPKGSRLIGTYNTQIASGQSRVFVVWTRVIRPDGVDVMINSPLVDQIGQSGIGGQVDTKFQQTFSRAVMASVISIAFAIGSDEISGGSTTTTSSSTGTSTTGDAATTATINALNRLGGTTDSFLQRFIGVQPSILVDQGTPVNVFVNRDLIFPSDLAGTRVIQ